MKNRYGDEYYFKKINDNTYTIVGNLNYWRYGGLEGQESLDYNNLGFVDPSGGPFIEIGTAIEGRRISRIRVDQQTNQILFEVDK